MVAVAVTICHLTTVQLPNFLSNHLMWFIYCGSWVLILSSFARIIYDYCTFFHHQRALSWNLWVSVLCSPLKSVVRNTWSCVCVCWCHWNNFTNLLGWWCQTQTLYPLEIVYLSVSSLKIALPFFLSKALLRVFNNFDGKINDSFECCRVFLI